MDEYVKICPKCRHVNPEDGGEVLPDGSLSVPDICGAPGCGEFLGSVIPTRATIDASKGDKQNLVLPAIARKAPDQEKPIHSADAEQKHRSPSVTMRYEDPVCYLELAGAEEVYEVRNGSVLGQAHPTSQANIQLSGLQGVNFVHREHCRFEYDNGQWFVTAIKRQSFTNPTHVNQQRLEPDRRYAIKNGDRLILAQIVFALRTIES